MPGHLRFGIALLAWVCWKPVYPLSRRARVSGLKRSLDLRRSLRSWQPPWAIERAQRILREALSTAICDFSVWRFFLPE